MEERNELCQALAQAEAVCGMESLLGLVFFGVRGGGGGGQFLQKQRKYRRLPDML